ncbi:MAG: hypothetical protein V7K48_09545 [Nostoc sp.]
MLKTHRGYPRTRITTSSAFPQRLQPSGVLIAKDTLAIAHQQSRQFL